MKYKIIPDEYFYTILDRLTRFEPAHIRYARVFDDIISKFLIEKKKISSIQEKITIVEEIIRNSIKDYEVDENVISELISIENTYFKKNPISVIYLKSRLNYKKMFEKLDKKRQNLYNMEFLSSILKKTNQVSTIKKIILCEGETEFVLLETIFRLLDYDLNKTGCLVIAAGGKNQVAKKYYKMLEYVNLPFFILLDKDGIEIRGIILSKLRKKDKLYIIKSGEFEDLIPANILLNTINFMHSSEIPCSMNDFLNSNSMVQNLDNIYRKCGFGEFKKARFAKEIKNFIENNASKNDFETSEINEILKALKTL